jgi:hypothetical protein
MNRKWIGIGIIVLGALILFAIVYVLFFHNFNQDNQAQTPSSVDTATTPAKVEARPEIPASAVAQIPKLTKAQIGQEELKRKSMLFAERLGSYSNQSTYQNLEDLKIFMTDNMLRWATDFVAKRLADTGDSQTYFGVSTKAVSAEVIKFDDANGIAEIDVSTQRNESTATVSNSKTYGQHLDVKLKKINGDWKIDSAIWGEQK